MKELAFGVFCIFSIIILGGAVAKIKNDYPYDKGNPNAFMDGVNNTVSCLGFAVLIAFLCKIFLI